MDKKKILHLLSFALLITLVYTGFVESYYYYEKDEELRVSSDGLNSIKVQLPFDYSKLGLCNDGKLDEVGGISDIFQNTQKFYTNLKLILGRNEQCKLLCVKKFSMADVVKYRWLIERHYSVNYFLDSLPARRTRFDIIKAYRKRSYFHWGTPLGYYDDDLFYIYNHYKIIVEINESQDKYQIVGFFLEPYSIAQSNKEDCINVKSKKMIGHNKNETEINIIAEEPQIKINEDEGAITEQLLTDTEIAFTYDIVFKKSDKTFSTRWDYYLPHTNEMHWVGLISANILVFIISFIVLFVFFRAIKKDIDIYNSKVIADDIIDEYGWKQVCNDVFRAPKHLTTLSTIIGTGIEIFFILIQTLYFSFIGLLSPESRATLINIFVILFCIMGFFSGFISTTIYKTNGGKQWLRCAIVTALFFPGLIIAVLTFSRIMFIFERSTGGVHLTHIFLLIALWFCLSTPLVLFGSLIALRVKTIKFPCKINAVPTKVEPKPFYLRLKYAFLFTGIIPFATVFIEFIYIMAAIWRHEAYFILSFIGLSTICLVISSAEISLLFVYLNLCKGDYQWWWKSFFVGASCAVYFFGYSIFYYFRINITRFTGSVVYFSMMGLISIGIGLVCGGCAVVFTFGFLYVIYSKIKVD